MRIRVTTLLFAACIVAPAVVSAQAQPAAPAAHPKPAQLPADSMQLGRKYTLWLYTVQSDSLIAHMDSLSRSQPNMAKVIEDGAAQLAVSAGSEESVIGEKFITRNGNRQYWRTAKFSTMPEPMVIRIVINAKGEIMGVGMNPASQTPPVDP